MELKCETNKNNQMNKIISEINNCNGENKIGWCHWKRLGIEDCLVGEWRLGCLEDLIVVLAIKLGREGQENKAGKGQRSQHLVGFSKDFEVYIF